MLNNAVIATLFVLALSSTPIHADTLPEETHDCTVVQLEEVDETTLTKAERIARMEQALQDSIDQRDRCAESTISTNSEGGAGAVSGGGSGLGSGGLGGGENEGESQNRGDSEESATLADVSEDSQQDSSIDQRASDPNGAKNQTIGPVDNDAAICQMLSEELQIETDPQKKKELKEIYKSYRCR